MKVAWWYLRRLPPSGHAGRHGRGSPLAICRMYASARYAPAQGPRPRRRIGCDLRAGGGEQTQAEPAAPPARTARSVEQAAGPDMERVRARRYLLSRGIYVNVNYRDFTPAHHAAKRQHTRYHDAFARGPRQCHQSPFDDVPTSQTETSECSTRTHIHTMHTPRRTHAHSLYSLASPPHRAATKFSLHP